ncbi:CDP-alcohol phosphatidyltransferase family protein [Candidatus Puniceispirillum sp.]|uniref:CDP-alcohol phosphatidyltransferase family protein n=1 Tax=Candidatus Puniceispirillum sp. TaxID=2026719 RepID=UPI001ECB357E|nr:CDP-alcohol phosphatidyltransferase family protein [Candidatus Puniceispirillum sp.]
MFDATLRPVVDAVMMPVARQLARWGVTANHMTVTGGFMGLVAVISITFNAFMVALVFIVINRLADGLDGAVARVSDSSSSGITGSGITDFGGYLDIVLDFIFYSAIPFAFALHDPANAVAACFLVFSFVGTTSSFLAFAIIAAKRGISTEVRGKKSFYHLGGLTEGTETIILLCMMTLMPSYFAVFAWVFGGLCWITTATRIADAHRMFAFK